MELIFESALVARDNNIDLYDKKQVSEILKLKYNLEEMDYMNSLLPRLCTNEQVHYAMSLVEQKKKLDDKRRLEKKRENELYMSYLESLIGNRSALRNQITDHVYLLPEGNYPSRRFVTSDYIKILPDEYQNKIKSDMRRDDDTFIIETVNTFNYLSLKEF
ncbi:TPA: hypothetical protein KDX48_002320 [Vibrio parahaemolyticus]|nr:hypothetical protein [Vibrio parahaemolyticus]